MDMALDTALEAFPEEELVRRDQIISLMANFKTALAGAREAETRVGHISHATDLSCVGNGCLGLCRLPAV